MGQPKMLLPWGETTVISHLISRWRAAGEQVCVVIPPSDPNLAAELSRNGFLHESRVVNPHPGAGMFSSIQCASASTAWSSGLTHVFVVLGDQPQLDPANVLAPLLAFTRAHPNDVCQPSLNGAPKHPVAIPRELFLSLARRQATSLKEVLREYPAQFCPIDDPRLALDLDFPADYARARELWPTG
jgi:molybdenum cofactor cytidylyltransferase